MHSRTLTTILSVLCLSACLQESKEDPEAASDRPAVESDRTAAARIGNLGGELKCESSKGLQFVLEIPPGSLPESTEIRLSPLRDFGTHPLAAGFLGGVRCEPSGLKFLRPVTLRIGGAQSLPSGKNLVGFSADDSGGTFRLGPARTDSQDILVMVTHFSLHGAAAATPGELEELPELAPLATPFEAAQEAIALTAISDAGASIEQIATILSRYYVESVKPALEKSAQANDATQVDGLSEYSAWRSLITFAAAINNRDVALIEAALAKEMGEANLMAAAALKRQIAASNGNCVEKSDISEFQEAAMWHETAQELGLDSLSFGLDRNAFLRDACVRVALDPLKLPSPLPVGTGKSLDARAQLIFQGSPDPVPGPFAFTLSAQGATLGTPEGFSDAGGRFTSVLTATGEGNVSVDVKACAVLSGVPDLCVRENVSERSPHRVETKILVKQYRYASAPFSLTDTCEARPLEDTSHVPDTLENGCKDTKMTMTWRGIQDGVELGVSATSVRQKDPAQRFPQFLLGGVEAEAVLYFLPEKDGPMEFQLEMDARPFATQDAEEVSPEWTVRISKLLPVEGSFDLTLDRDGSIQEGKDPAAVTFIPKSMPDTLKLKFEFLCGYGCSGEGATFRISQKKAAP